jgi:hypothetical protein
MDALKRRCRMATMLGWKGLRRDMEQALAEQLQAACQAVQGDLDALKARWWHTAVSLVTSQHVV